MGDLLKALVSANVATILLVAGLAFLLIAVVRNIAGKVEADRVGRIAAAAIGATLTIAGLGLHFIGTLDAERERTAAEKAVVEKTAAEKAAAEKAAAEKAVAERAAAARLAAQRAAAEKAAADRAAADRAAADRAAADRAAADRAAADRAAADRAAADRAAAERTAAERAAKEAQPAYGKVLAVRNNSYGPTGASYTVTFDGANTGNRQQALQICLFYLKNNAQVPGTSCNNVSVGPGRRTMTIDLEFSNSSALTLRSRGVAVVVTCLVTGDERTLVGSTVQPGSCFRENW